MIYERVALIGMGLIASSIALAARKHGIVGELAGCTRSEETRAVATQLGLVDQMHSTPEATVKDADLVLLCTPVMTFGGLAERIAPHLKQGATLSDVGSVKRHVIAEVGPHVPQGVDFVPAHPLAGTERSGPTAGFAELFENRWCLMTPLPETGEAALDRLERFWKGLGSNVEYMDAEHHDLVLAMTSHAPHLIAYTLVGVADDLRRVTNSEVIQYSAAGFRDFTRIAASDPTMWRDVFLSNKDSTLEVLGRFTEELFALQRAIRTGQGDQLHAFFTRTRSIRQGIIDAGQDTAQADFGRVAEHGE